MFALGCFPPRLTADQVQQLQRRWFHSTVFTFYFSDGSGEQNRCFFFVGQLLTLAASSKIVCAVSGGRGHQSDFSFLFLVASRAAGVLNGNQCGRLTQILLPSPWKKSRKGGKKTTTAATTTLLASPLALHISISPAPPPLLTARVGGTQPEDGQLSTQVLYLVAEEGRVGERRVGRHPDQIILKLGGHHLVLLQRVREGWERDKRETHQQETCVRQHWLPRGVASHLFCGSRY